MTDWQPDTCPGADKGAGCHVRLSLGAGGWFGVTPADVTVLKKCAAHAAVPDNQLFDVIYRNNANGVIGENKRRNDAMSWITTNTPAGELVNGSWQLKNGVTINTVWSGSGADRVVTVSVTGVNITPQQKAAAQAWCNATFGAGKVVIA